jgi:hypothetical protein
VFLRVAASTTKYVSNLSLFVSKVVSIYEQLSGDLDLLAVKSQVLPIRKDR